MYYLDLIFIAVAVLSGIGALLRYLSRRRLVKSIGRLSKVLNELNPSDGIASAYLEGRRIY